MDKNIEWSLRVISGEFEFDKGSFDFAKNELQNRIKELTPLFNECIEKDISMQYEYTEISNEWNTIILTLAKNGNR